MLVTGSMRPAAQGADLAARRGEEFAEQTLGLAEPVLGEGDRFGLADWIGDEAFLVQPVEGVPVEAFPGAAAIMQAQIEEGEGEPSIRSVSISMPA